MIRDITFEKVPAFAIVEKQMQTLIPNAEVVKAQLDEAPYHYLLDIRVKTTKTLRLSKELLDDLPGKNNDHRRAQLNLAIRDLFGSMK
jgi:hypothetical protein